MQLGVLRALVDRGERNPGRVLLPIFLGQLEDLPAAPAKRQGRGNLFPIGEDVQSIFEAARQLEVARRRRRQRFGH